MNKSHRKNFTVSRLKHRTQDNTSLHAQIVQFLQWFMSRMLDRSALRMKNLNCFRVKIFLASDETLFHSLGPV